MRRLLIVALLLLAGCDDGARFDAGRWRDADLATRERAEMAEDLIRSHRLDGLDRTAVVALLGDATPSDAGGNGTMVYVLGPDGSRFPIDNAWLLIELDAQERVESYRVVVD
ncbi:MAG: hypothetical protein EON85_02585 [Brevundimonas sp.]|nr:MAG: hypothetical protein EON85_02585 [Brevundimonas sp.]